MKQKPGDSVQVLDTPQKCRKFIKSVRFPSDSGKPNRITFLQQADGTQVSIDDATDAQVIQVASELASALNRAGAH